MKLQHDFLGSIQRLRARSSEFQQRTDELMSRWRDATGAEFHEQHLAPVLETLRRLTLSLQDAAELASRCGKALEEEGRLD